MWFAGPPSAACSSRWCSSAVAPLWPAPPARPSGSRPSRVPAGSCCASPSAARRGSRPRTGHPTGAGTTAPERGRTVADGTPEEIHRSADRFPRTRTLLFSQLLAPVHHPVQPPPNPRSTCTERASGDLRTLRGLATATRRTSLHAPRVQRFVIECFTPSCQVDNVPSAEPATSARRDTVDSILTVYGGGLVQDRGETCRSDTTEEPRPPRGA